MLVVLAVTVRFLARMPCRYLNTLCFSFTAKNCGPLTVPLNGSLTGNDTTFPNEASFSCDEGFILNGSMVRRCQADGTWSGVRTTCKGEIDLHIRANV